MSKRKWHHHVHHFVVPHQGNNFRPGAIGTAAIVTVLVAALLFEGLYLAGTKISVDRTSFLASVLPAALVSLTNADRAEAGVGEVKEDKVLAEAAQLKANDMAEKGYFSHVSPDGTQPWQWIEKAGYSYTYAGENLAVNFEDSKDVAEAWMNSPSHKANIVKAQYTHVGIATARGTYKGKEVTFVVQFFASPKVASAAPAPVASEPAPVAPVAVAETPEETQVLGEEIEAASPIETTVVQAAASPNHTVTTVLSILAGLLLLMFVIALIAHIKLPYVEALAGTVTVLVIVAGLLAFNESQMLQVEVPTDTAAAAILAF